MYRLAPQVLTFSGIDFNSVSDPDPDPYQEALIWIRVAPKDYSGKKSIFFKIFNYFVTFRPVSEYIINIVYKL